MCVMLLWLQLTGRHIVRDISCKNCGTRLGWIYVRCQYTRSIIASEYASLIFRSMLQKSLRDTKFVCFTHLALSHYRKPPNYRATRIKAPL